MRILVALLTLAAPAIALEARLARHPSPSPDRTQIVFSWQGDLWSVAATGGNARRLTAHPGLERSPVWSRDGRWLAFASDRHGSLDVFVMPVDGSETPRRLTHEAGDAQPVDFSHDGGTVLFTAGRADAMRREVGLYRVPVSGGSATLEQPALGYGGSWSPDGKHLAFVRGNTPEGRHGYRGSGSRGIWLRARDGGFRKLSTFEGDEDAPGWVDSEHVLMRSSRSQRKNLFVVDLTGGDPRAITSHEGSDVRSPRLSADGRLVAYEFEDAIYTLPTTTGSTPTRLSIEVPADFVVDPITRHVDKADADELQLHPQGELIAMVIHGDVFVTGLRPKDEQDVASPATVAITNTAARERDLAWALDGKSLTFSSDRSGNHDIYRAKPRDGKTWTDSFDFEIGRFVAGPTDEREAQPSPDGKRFAFVRGNGDLWIADTDGTNERVVVSHWADLDYEWSPDGRFLAYATDDHEHNTDVWIVAADGGTPYNVSRHPDEDRDPHWSPDGRRLLWVSRRHANAFDVWATWLTVADDERGPDDWLKLWKADEKSKDKDKKKDTAKTGGKATAEKRTTRSNDDGRADEGDEQDDEKESVLPEVKIDFERLWERSRSLAPIEGDESSPLASRDGKRIVFTGEPEGERDLFSVRWDGKDRKRLTTGGKSPRTVTQSKDGKTIFFLTQKGAVERIDPDGKAGDPVPYSARHEVDRAAERAATFDEAWRTLGDHFYDPRFHGADWTAIRDRYRPWALSASHDGDFTDVMRWMLGELNSSHLNYSPKAGEGGEKTGTIGARFDPAGSGPGLLVREVLPDSPAARLDVGLKVGERITAIGNVPLLPADDIDARFIDQIGQRVPMTVVGVDGKVREVVIVPIAAGDERQLRYRQWVRERRAVVDRLGNGRLGYIHIQGMNEPSFEEFERDLYAAAHGKDGLIIDVRSNGGGWTTDYVMAVLNVKRHARTVPRGSDPKVLGYPQDRLPLAAWTRPAIALCNEESFSNAEIFSWAFQGLGRGKLVGTPTFGGVISTGGTTLVNGGWLRLPFRGWYVAGSEINMENHGAVPDVIVAQPPEQDTSPDRDAQLERAIEVFLADIDQDPRKGAW